MVGSQRKTIIITVLIVLFAVAFGYLWWLASGLTSFIVDFRQLVADEIRDSSLSEAAQENLIQSIRAKAPPLRGFGIGTSESSALYLWDV